MNYRVVFMGTPEFAVPSLQALLEDPSIELVGVMTQPDRPAGRGQKLTPPPVKVLALEHHLEVRQPTRLRKEPEMIDWLREKHPDYLVTAAFGQILSQEVLDIPQYGTVNVHASLLPKYRGPNPVQWCLLNGDENTGVTTMFTELDVDSGPMLLQTVTPIDPNEDTVALMQRLSRLGAGILAESLHRYAEKTLKAQPQDISQVTHAPKLDKPDAIIDWSQPALVLHNKIRGQHPSPGTVTIIDGLQLKVIKSLSPRTWKESEQFVKRGEPGEIMAIIKEGIVVQTGSGPLLVEMVQPPGKPKMAARDWANGFLKDKKHPKFDLTQKIEVS